jgi:hypothetical protein
MSILDRPRNAEFGVFRGFLMKKNSGRFLIWSYRRGSIQYDIVCILILAFTFLLPRGCFVSGKNEPPETTEHQTVEESQNPAGAAQP